MNELQNLSGGDCDPSANVASGSSEESIQKETQASLKLSSKADDDVKNLIKISPCESNQPLKFHPVANETVTFFNEFSSNERNKINKSMKKNASTSTDFNHENDTTGSKCKYCKARLSKLRLLERIKAKKSLNRSPYHLNRSLLSRKQICANKSCQTSPGLFAKAEMTDEEHQSLAMILRMRSGRIDKNETFCKCVLHGKEKDCQCGESSEGLEWVWDPENRAEATDLCDDGSQVIFHKNFSRGTAAVRGNEAMEKDQHFWEIKMTTLVYGTDMMIGLGTSSVDMDSYSNSFCSMLGYDKDSWGISYDGRVQHNGHKRDYCSRFGQGAIIGVHLDMWHGRVAFFKNRRALGTAYKGLRGRPLYPMACSTAARSRMKVISSSSFPTSLQFMCSQKLRQCVPPHLNVLDVLEMPPGLKRFLANKMAWLLNATRPQPKRLSFQNSVCSICKPFKFVLEGLTDFEDSDEEELRDVHLLIPSDSESSDENEGEENVHKNRNALSFILSGKSKNHSNHTGAGISSQQENDSSEESGEYPFDIKRFKHDSRVSDAILDETQKSGKMKRDGIDKEKNFESPENIGDDSDMEDTSSKKSHPVSRKRSHQ